MLDGCYSRNLIYIYFLLQFAFVSCCTHSGESTKSHLHKLKELFDKKGWSQMSSVRHLCTCEQNIDSHLIRRRLSANTFALSTTAELFGVIGVPTIVIINSEGMNQNFPVNIPFKLKYKPFSWDSVMKWKISGSGLQGSTLHKKMKFSIKDYFSKCDQIAVNCGFGHIYWRNL